MLRKKLLAVLTGAVAVAAIAFAGVAVANAGQDADNGTASLVHEGLNPNTCGQVPGADSGVVNVHSNVVKDRRRVNLSVHDALPNTTYVVDIRCVGQIGSLTTNEHGTGTAHLELAGSAWPSQAFYVDISVPGGGPGGGYGDTFVAGPFSAS